MTLVSCTTHFVLALALTVLPLSINATFRHRSSSRQCLPCLSKEKDALRWWETHMSGVYQRPQRSVCQVIHRSMDSSRLTPSLSLPVQNVFTMSAPRLVCSGWCKGSKSWRLVLIPACLTRNISQKYSKQQRLASVQERSSTSPSIANQDLPPQSNGRSSGSSSGSLDLSSQGSFSSPVFQVQSVATLDNASQANSVLIPGSELPWVS